MSYFAGVGRGPMPYFSMPYFGLKVGREVGRVLLYALLWHHVLLFMPYFGK